MARGGAMGRIGPAGTPECETGAGGGGAAGAAGGGASALSTGGGGAFGGAGGGDFAAAATTTGGFTAARLTGAGAAVALRTTLDGAFDAALGAGFFGAGLVAVVNDFTVAGLGLAASFEAAFAFAEGFLTARAGPDFTVGCFLLLMKSACPSG